jgi:hypothetical protein
VGVCATWSGLLGRILVEALVEVVDHLVDVGLAPVFIVGTLAELNPCLELWQALDDAVLAGVDGVVMALLAVGIVELFADGLGGRGGE